MMFLVIQQETLQEHHCKVHLVINKNNGPFLSHWLELGFSHVTPELPFQNKHLTSYLNQFPTEMRTASEWICSKRTVTMSHHGRMWLENEKFKQMNRLTPYK